MDHVDPATFGLFLVCLCAVITFVLQATVALLTIFDRLWPKPVPVGVDSPVKRSDLDNAMVQLGLKIDALASRETVTALSTRMLALEQATERSEKYAHESIHRINGSLQTVVSRVDVLAIKIDTHLGHCPPDAIKRKRSQRDDDGEDQAGHD